jgi:sugar phosphate isomerase/epimerase
MKLGAYTAVLHDKPLPEALSILREMGLESAEINSGGFLPAPHLPVDAIRSSATAGEEYLGLFADAGMTLTALNCNGHDVDFWADFLAALEKVDPDMAVNIEHEDRELDQLEGLRYAANTLLQASGGSGMSTTTQGAR